MSQILKLYYLNIRGIKSKFKPLFTVTKEMQTHDNTIAETHHNKEKN